MMTATRSEQRAAASTVDALVYELREYGLQQLKNPNCLRRLEQLSAKQVREVTGRLLAIQANRIPHKVTDELVLTIGGLVEWA